MNYEKIYNRIIQNAILENRIKGKEIYYEIHHIIPKCIGGNNKKNNLVLLTAKEHFICHKLLCKIYPFNIKLVYAFQAMHVINKGRKYIINAKEYDIIKNILKHDKSYKMKNNNPMKNLSLRNQKRIEMLGTNNLYFKLTPEQKNKHAVNVSKSKMGDKNPNAKKCIHVNTGQIFGSAADCIRALKLKGSANYLYKTKIIQWI